MNQVHDVGKLAKTTFSSKSSLRSMTLLSSNSVLAAATASIAARHSSVAANRVMVRNL